MYNYSCLDNTDEEMSNDKKTKTEMNSDNEDDIFEIKSEDEDYFTEHDNETNIISPNEERNLKKNKSRKNTFSKEDRRALAAEVRKHVVVWDLAHPLRSRTNVVSNAWKEISVKMGKPIPECKAAWSSLRKAKRYRTKAGSKNTSLNQPDWEFAKDLDFLPSVNGNKSTKKQPIVNARNKKLNITYIEVPSTPSPTISQQSSTARITESIEPLVIQKPMEQPAQQQHRLVYYSLWSNLDRMLQKLPENMIEDINYEFTTKLYKKLKQNNKNNKK